MTTGMANKAAIVFEEAPDASTTGIIFATVLYGVRDVGSSVIRPCKSWDAKLRSWSVLEAAFRTGWSLPQNLSRGKSSQVAPAPYRRVKEHQAFSAHALTPSSYLTSPL
jgi:hypothetical protein